MRPGRPSRRIALLGACASAAAVWALAPAAWAADIQITKSAETSLTYTDNIDLDPDDEADQAIIWTNTGATTVRATGARVQAALDAALSLDTSVEDDGTSVDLRPNLHGIGTVELLEDHFFVDGEALALLSLENPFGAVSASPASGRDDRTTVYSVGVSPYWVQNFGSWAQSELRYRHNRIYYGDEDLGDTVTNAASLHTQTGRRFTRFLIGNDLEYEKIDSEEEDGDAERKTALLDGQYVLTREFIPVGTIGYEDIQAEDLRDDPKGLVWNVGFIARPGPRSEFEFRYGERYDETNILASARYLISPRLTFQAGYTKILDLSGGEVLRQTDVIVDEQGRLVDARTGLPIRDVQDLFGVEDESFLADRFDASLAGSYGRNNFLLLASYEMRDFEFQPDEKLLTTSGRWDRALTPDTRIGFSAGYRTAKEDDPGTEDTDTVLGRIQVTHDLAENFQALAAYSYSRRFADDESDEYTENAVTVGLRVTF